MLQRILDAQHEVTGGKGPVWPMTYAEATSARKRLIETYNAPDAFSWQALRKSCQSFLASSRTSTAARPSFSLRSAAGIRSKSAKMCTPTRSSSPTQTQPPSRVSWASKSFSTRLPKISKRSRWRHDRRYEMGGLRSRPRMGTDPDKPGHWRLRPRSRSGDTSRPCATTWSPLLACAARSELREARARSPTLSSRTRADSGPSSTSERSRCDSAGTKRTARQPEWALSCSNGHAKRIDRRRTSSVRARTSRRDAS